MKTLMTTPSEVQRLRAVYRQILESQTVRTRWSLENPGNRALLEERTRVLEELLRSRFSLPLREHRILDVGCGSGAVLAGFLKYGASPESLYGVDLLPERIREARERFPKLHFQTGNAEALEFPDQSFHLVLLFTVFCSILDDRMARNVAREVARVLRPGGAVVWYDLRYNNPWNPHLRGMRRQTIQELFHGFEVQLRPVTLLPPLARRLGRATATLYPLLGAVSWLRTHYLGLLVKPL